MHKGIFKGSLVAAALGAGLATGLVAGCSNDAPRPAALRTADSVEVVAQSMNRWTGLAVGHGGQLVVSYPRWSDDVPMSVARVVDGRQVAFPEPSWQDWSPGAPSEMKWVAVQSVTVSPGGWLYVLDSGSPKRAGTLPGAAKISVFDLATNKLVRTYHFDSSVVSEKSYLNDLRVDPGDKHAIITESGEGSLIVLDLQSGEARKVLADHPSTKAEPTQLLIEGNSWLKDGKTPVINADGIAIDYTHDIVYWQSLTGRTLYSLPLKALINPAKTDEDLAGMVKKVADVGPADGLECGLDGMVYLTALEDNAIVRLNPFTKKSTVIAQGDILKFPASLAWGPEHALYVSCAQLHLADHPAKPFVVVRVPQLQVLQK